MANLVDKINEKHIRKDIPEFRVGDTVRVDVWVKEGKKEREGASPEGQPNTVSQDREDSYGKHRTMYAAHTTELAKTDANATTLEKL